MKTISISWERGSQRRVRMVLSALTLLPLLLVDPVSAAGVVDPNFTPPAGFQGVNILAMRTLADGTTVVATSSSFMRLNTNGSQDGSYNAGNITAGTADVAEILPDGRIIIAGPPLTINGVARGSVVRVLENGTVDPGFASLSSSGFGAPTFRNVLIDAGGRIYLTAWNLNTFGGLPAQPVIRLTADGAIDTAFVPESGPPVQPRIGLFSDGDLLLARSSVNELVRLTGAGMIVPAFASNISPHSGNITFIAMDAADRPIMGSAFPNSPFGFTNGMARLLPNGVIDPGFAPRTLDQSTVDVLTIDRFGRYYVGGGFTSYDGVPRSRLMRLFPDGSLDPTFAADCNGSVFRLRLAPDGKLLVAGGFNAINGTTVSRLARLLVDDLAEPPAFQLIATNHYEFDSVASVAISVMRVGPTNAPASVNFATTAGTAIAGIDYTEVTGTLDFAAGEDLKQINVPVLHNPEIGPAKSFRLVLSTPSNGTALSSRSEARITLIDSDAQLMLAQDSLLVVEGAGTASIQVKRVGTGSVAGLRFSGVDGTALSGLHYRLPAGLVQFKEGETNRSVSFALLDDPIENADRNFTLRAGAVEGAILATSADVIITIADDDLAGLPGLSIGSDGLVVSGVLALHRDFRGRTVVGGGFNLVNGSPVNNLTRLLPGGDIDPAFNAGTGPNGVVYSIVEDRQGRLLVGGHFTTYNGSPAGRIVRLLEDGTRDASFTTGTGFDSIVERLEVLPDDRILAGGFFRNFSGIPRLAVAILEAEGNLDTSFVPSAGITSFFHAGHGAFHSPAGIVVLADASGGGTNAIYRLSPSGARDPGFLTTFSQTFPAAFLTGAHVQPDGRIVIAGTFDSVNGASRNNIARLNSDGSLDPTFDPGSGADDWVFRVYPLDQGKLLLVGNFISYDGVPRKYVARINSDGSLDQTFDPGPGPDAEVRVAVVEAGGGVQLGGSFREIQGVQRVGLGAVAADGTLELVRPQFLPASPQAGILDLALIVEPGFDVRLLKAGSVTGEWSPVSTNRTYKRVLKFAPTMSPTGNEFFKAEMLVPE